MCGNGRVRQAQGTQIWSDIANATVSTYTPVTRDEGKLLRVTLSYDDAVSGGRSATSTSTHKVGKPGVMSLNSSMPVVGESLIATLTDDDATVSSEVWQWESSPAQPEPVLGTYCGSYVAHVHPGIIQPRKLIARDCGL